MAPLYVRSNGRRAAAAPAPRGAAVQPFGLPAPERGAVQLPSGISLCMIVKDEERFLEGCLRSVTGHVDEICIVDTGSTDRTIEIAAAFGARVEHRPWRNDFAWARNEALALATKRWILVLDADEELDAGSHAALAQLRTVAAGVTGLWVRCNNLSDDYKGTGVSSHALVRCFPNSPRIRYLSPVHEFITLDGKPTGLDARQAPLSITHHGYLSEIVKSRKKSERNLALVKAATESAPDEPFNWYNLGTTSLLCGDPEAAIAAFEHMRAMVGETARGFIPNAFAQLADLYTDRGDFERAIDAANESLRKAPHFANAHFALGRAFARQRRYPEARAAFEAAIADAEHAARQFIVDDEVSAWKAHSEIGSTYGYEGNDVAALEWFDRALEARPQVVPLRMNRAKALERLGRLGEARAVFAQLAADEPGDAHTVDYINFLLRCHEHAAAIETIESSLEAVTPRVRAALLVTAAKLCVDAAPRRRFLERALAAHAGAADALDALEALYRADGDLAAVERLRAEELDAPLELPMDYARRGTRFLGLNRLDDAEAVTRAGLDLAPQDAALRYNLAAALVQTGRKEDALHELARAGTEGDIGLRAAFLRAIVLGELGRLEAALVEIDRVLAAAPAENDARLHRFRYADALGRADEAEATLRAGLAYGDARIAAELAGWLLRNGRFGEAQAVAERALSHT